MLPVRDETPTVPVEEPAIAAPAQGLGLTCLYSPCPSLDGHWLPLSAERVVIGRSPGGASSLAVSDAAMSRRHAALCASADRASILVTDLGSRNGVIARGERRDRAVLSSGDVVRLGNSLLLACARLPAPDSTGTEERLVGVSRALAEARSRLRAAATLGLPVLLEGETGTGKEVTARELHRLSGRRGPFVAVNCAAIPETLFEAELFGAVRGAFSGATSRAGVFERADGGTLLLDEVGELTTEGQPKLLRVLEEQTIRRVGCTRERPVDVLVVSATPVPLEDAVRAVRFRRDLLARLRGWTVELPPLRERPEDVLPAWRHLLRVHARAGPGVCFSADVAEALVLHDWPDNVRGIEMLARRVSGSRRVELSDLPLAVAAPLLLRRTGSEPTDPGRQATAERERVEAALARYDGNVARAARELGKGRNQLYRWMARFGIDVQRFREGSG